MTTAQAMDVIALTMASKISLIFNNFSPTNVIIMRPPMPMKLSEVW